MTRAYWNVRALRGLAPTVLSAAVSICVTVTTMHGLPKKFTFPELWEWPGLKWVAAAGVLAAITLWGVLRWFHPTYGELQERLALAEQERDEVAERTADELAQHRAALQGALDELLSQLAAYVYGDTVDARVSAYSVEGNEFVLLARHSKNPAYEKRGRSSYKLTQGAIGVAWAREWVLENSETETRTEWEEGLVEQGFSLEEARGLTMYARSIYGQRLDRGTTKAGVVVFEAEDKDKFNVKTLKKVERSYLRETLAAVISASHGFFPRVQERQQELEGTAPVALVPEPVWKRTELPAQSSLAIPGDTEPR